MVFGFRKKLKHRRAPSHGLWENTHEREPTCRPPFRAIIVLFALLFLVPVVSIHKLLPSFRSIDDNYDSRTLHLAKSNVHPIVVYLDDTPWSRDTPTGTSSAATRGHEPLVLDPVQLERPDDINPGMCSTNANETTMDLTRFYDTGDDDEFPCMERRQWPHHEFDSECEPSAQWQSTFYPVCNEVHAGTDLPQAFVTQELSLLGKGHWRHAWRNSVGSFNASSSESNPDTVSVWKTLRLQHNFEEKYYEDHRIDAIAMERLTASPYVINIYGYCGMTIVQEFAGRELVHVVDHGQWNSTARLRLAQQITQGVADMHSIPGDTVSKLSKIRGKQPISQPSLVHNDLNLANLMFTADDRPVHNDFNIAILLMKERSSGKTCPFYSKFPNPQWKAPEEKMDSVEDPPIVDEKIDIYALGNVFYRMAVGASPWKRPTATRVDEEEKAAIARLKRYNGTMPSVPLEIMEQASTDVALASLIEAMRLCYKFQPKLRPSARELVAFFDDALLKAT